MRAEGVLGMRDGHDPRPAGKADRRLNADYSISIGGAHDAAIGFRAKRNSREVRRRSGAGTGTFALEASSGLWNELQAGSYVFMDTEYARIGGKNGGRYTEFQHSLFVLATVMSVPAGDRAIVDAGLKSYSSEKGPPWVHGREDLEVIGVSDEHGKLKVGPKADRLRLGDKLMLIPGHCDPTVNLHDWYVAVRAGRVESLWPITARGASS